MRVQEADRSGSRIQTDLQLRRGDNDLIVEVLHFPWNPSRLRDNCEARLFRRGSSGAVGHSNNIPAPDPNPGAAGIHAEG